MLQFFRNIFKSKIGVGVTMVFLGLIALAFASADVSNSGGFGGIAGGDRVATVGSERVDSAALSQAAMSVLENLKQQNPRLSMQAFLAGGGLEKTLDQLIDRAAMGEFGKRHGIVAGDRLIDSEIAKIPGLSGPDGKFSDAIFRQMLQQRGLSESFVRRDLGQALIEQQLVIPAQFGSMTPDELVRHYVSLRRDHRTGAIAMVPSAVFASRSPPTDAELNAYYLKNRDRFIRPERRVVRYAVFGEEALKSVPAPTEAEIAARYNANKASYAALETRRITQLVVPTEPAARAIESEVAKGRTLEAVAREKGLSTAALGDLSKAALTAQTSQAVADAAFGTAQGKLTAPARSGLGWHVLRIDGVTQRPERSLADVRGELLTQLTEAKRRAAINDLTARMEDEFSNGSTLSDASKELGLTVQSTEPMTADGQIYGKAGQTAPAALAKVIGAAFSMEQENQPQLAEVEAGKTFIMFDVSSITPSAPAPAAEIRSELLIGLTLEKGAAAAKAAAQKVQAQVAKGTDIGAAMASLGVPTPPVDRVDFDRTQLTARGQQVPAPLALLFSMAEGTTKLLPAPNNRGWYVVTLKDIVPGKVEPNDPFLAETKMEVGGVTGREYAEALRRAIRDEVGVERNASAIAAVRKQLQGGN